MLQLDHLTVLAPTLSEGVAHVRACLGVDMPTGGAHPEMGTHNRLLRLGDDVFLEVIAIDPDAHPPGRPRWFGLDDISEIRSAWDSGQRLRGWVARTDDLAAVEAHYGRFLGQRTQVSRGDRSWHFLVPPDGSRPGAGVAPSVMDWGARGTPAPTMPDLGVRLTSFAVEHPDPARVAELYRYLGVARAPTVCQGEELRYRAVLATPAGPKELT